MLRCQESELTSGAYGKKVSHASNRFEEGVRTSRGKGVWRGSQDLEGKWESNRAGWGKVAQGCASQMTRDKDALRLEQRRQRVHHAERTVADLPHWVGATSLIIMEAGHLLLTELSRGDAYFPDKLLLKGGGLRKETGETMRVLGPQDINTDVGPTLICQMARHKGEVMDRAATWDQLYM